MSERMNNDRAIEILESYLREYKETLQEYEDKNIPHDKGYIHHKKTTQALDIAIDSLQNDDLIKRLENGECCKHSSNKIVAYNRDYLDENLEMEFDLLKNTRDTVQAIRKGASDDEVAERLVKVVDPYERKE